MKDLKRLIWVFVGICGIFVGITGKVLQGSALVPVDLQERAIAGAGGLVAFAVGLLLLLQGRGQPGQKTDGPGGKG